MSLFKNIVLAAPDAILGLTDAFKADPHPQKINLGVGVFKDENGVTPVLSSVKKAEKQLFATEASKAYLPISGAPAYATAVQDLLLGVDSEIVAAKRAVTLQTPGGTGALRLAGDFIATHFPQARIWISAPTWPNHPSIFSSAGVPQITYPYFNAETNGLDFEGMQAALKTMRPGDICLLHGCCHNPTGVDLTAAQWSEIARIIKQREGLALLDFAYQGFSAGIDEDAVGIRAFNDAGLEFFIASSFSKNFGLYNERVGALTAVTADADAAERVMSQLKLAVRTNYSNPPSHGGSVVTTILNTPDLRREWRTELASMRNRINGIRKLLVQNLQARNVSRDPSFMAKQHGMFSFSGLKPEEVKILQEKYSIYIVGSGRINVAGITEKNINYLCDAIAEVTQ